jgi:hypothetical protein
MPPSRKDRRRDRHSRAPLAGKLIEIGRRCALPTLDPRPANDILDWDEQGLPR